MKHGRSDLYARLAIAALFAALLFTGYLLYKQYSRAERADIIRLEKLHLSDIRVHRPLGAADSSYIQPWMTFDYISAIFRVPSAYLASDLALSGNGYPRISINRYAGAHGINADTLTSKVADAVRAYLSASSTVATTTPSTGN